MSAACERCAWASPNITAEGDLVLECRLQPPQVFTVNGDVMVLFPQVAGDDWCSHWASTQHPSERKPNE